jgi:hypothetical protein
MKLLIYPLKTKIITLVQRVFFVFYFFEQCIYLTTLVARQKIRAASAGDFFCRFALIGSLGVAT